MGTNKLDRQFYFLLIIFIGVFLNIGHL